MSMAFPTLSPFGNAELHDECCENNMEMTPMEYLQYLHEYENKRFIYYIFLLIQYRSMKQSNKEQFFP